MTSLPKPVTAREMGQSNGRFAFTLGSRELSDLNDEQVEEIHMVTSLPASEIHRIRTKYRACTTQETMSRDEFFALPGAAVNPLKERLFRIFELTSDMRVPFDEFARFVAIYSYHSSQDTKLREAFRIHDFDGDGKISRDDLRKYLHLTCQTSIEDGEPPEDTRKRQDEIVEVVVSRVMEEASSDPAMEYLAYEDFMKVIRPTDFESRLIFPF